MMQSRLSVLSFVFALLWMCIRSHVVAGQPLFSPYEKRPLGTTLTLGGGPEGQGGATQIVQIPAAMWLRLTFGDHNLPAGSFVMITSLHDGGLQYHDSRTLSDWGNTTAGFNGDAVEVTLHSDPGTPGVFITLGEVMHGGPEPPPESQCGNSDDRVPSSDPAVGRLVFFGASDIARCTAWITSNASNLTAGHCVPLGGAGNPDLMEFNYPNSTAGGTPVFADPEDQYPIDQATITGTDGGQGNDWGRFGCNANSNTGLRPVQAQNAFYRMSRDTTQAGAPTIRITGNGTDAGVRNRIQQTHTGANLGENFTSATDVCWEYTVDTEAGNSGAPIIVNGTSITLGIHTHAGCNPPNAGNHGTSFEHNDLENAVQTFVGPNPEYVDIGHPISSALENGTVLRPFNTVTEAVNTVASGGVVSMVEGSYTAAAGNTFTAGADGRAMTFEAPVGAVTIGN